MLDDATQVVVARSIIDMARMICVCVSFLFVSMSLFVYRRAALLIVLLDCHQSYVMEYCLSLYGTSLE